MCSEDSKKSKALVTLQTKYHGIDHLVKLLESSSTAGILGTPEDLKKRSDHFGHNRNKPPKKTTLCQMFWECFEDTMIRILVVAAIVSLICGYIQHGFRGLIEGVSIIISIMIITVVTVWNNWVKEKQFQQLQSQGEVIELKVTRNGESRTVTSEDLVVGDLIDISSGTAVSADCILVSGMEFACNETSMTGESKERNKEPVKAYAVGNPCPFLLKTTLTNDKGNGKAIVVAVGDST